MSEKATQPQHSDNLRAAHKEIKKVLDKYNVSGVCVMFEPGFTELVIKIDPSWSVVSVTPDNILKITPPLVDESNPNASKEKIAATVNMLFNLRTSLQNVIRVLFNAELNVRRQFGIEPPQNVGNPVVKPSANGNGLKMS